MLSRDEIELLMEAQYNFPKGPWPFHLIAEKLGINTEEVVGILRNLSDRGVIKRVGFYVNYRSIGLKAALIAYTAGSNAESVAEIYSKDIHATHVYLRDHPRYNLWVVTKRKTVEDLVQHAKEVANRYNMQYVVLLSKRTYKLSVKFDLKNGISKAGPYSEIKQNLDPPEKFGLTSSQLRKFRSLSISLNPYRKVADSIGVPVEKAAAIAWKLVELGLLGDPGVSLDGKKIGFEKNAMVAVKPQHGNEDELCRCLSKLDFTTHVVLRESIPKNAWNYTCYFMIHTRNEERLRGLIDSAVKACNLQNYLVLRSIRDLKPGVIR